MQLIRVVSEPILTPRRDVPWEKDAVLNCAAIHDGGRFHLLYRTIVNGNGGSHRSYIGYAGSEDGVNFERLNEPVLSPGEFAEESVGVEDPRITKIGDTYHLVYAAWDGKQARIAMATSSDLINWQRRGVIFSYDIFGHNKNGALFPEKINGKYALIHRPMGFEKFGERDYPLDMWISFSYDLFNWHDHQCILKARPGTWEHTKIGVGASPIKTDSGWLVLYHAVDKDYTYRLGAVLLALDKPTKVIKRTGEPVLEPQEPWEKVNGWKVVFTGGAVLLDSELSVYYGGADLAIGRAKGSVEEVLAECPSGGEYRQRRSFPFFSFYWCVSIR